MSSRFRGLQPWLEPYAQYLFDSAQRAGFRPIVTSVFRSNQKQATLYERWKRGLSDLPAAPPGRSKHNHGLAFDIVVEGGYRGPRQRELGAYWRQMGGRWFSSDPVHFEV